METGIVGDMCSQLFMPEAENAREWGNAVGNLLPRAVV